MSFEQEVKRFHRQNAVTARDSSAEERKARKDANPEKHPQATSKSGQQYRNHLAQQTREMRSTAQHAQNNLKSDDESLVEWAREEEREPEHKGKDARLAVHEYRERYGHERGVDEEGEDSSQEERTSRKQANAEKVSREAHVDRPGIAEYIKEKRKSAENPWGTQGRFAARKAHRETKSDDASAAQVAEGVGHVAGKVKEVAGHVERGAAVGARLAEGRVMDNSPLARAVRRAQQDSTPEERSARKESSERAGKKIGPLNEEAGGEKEMKVLSRYERRGKLSPGSVSSAEITPPAAAKRYGLK